MRVDFVKAVQAELDRDASSLFITGDLGYNALEGVAQALGRRFLNAGVAEQNMIGMAAGMALAGHRPWVYSIAPFVTYRCLEQIRNDVCLHQLPVRIVGNGGGYTYGIMGSTHHTLEELAALKPLPNMTLFFPCTNDHVASAVAQMGAMTGAHSGPAYLRLAISGFAATMAPLAENPATLTRTYARGSKATVIGVGHAAQIAIRCLTEGSLSDIAVFGVARYPFDLESDAELVESARKTGHVIVLDEHYLPGSLAESLALALPRQGTFDVLCASYSPEQKYGSPAFHLKQCGMTPDALLELVKKRTLKP